MPSTDLPRYVYKYQSPSAHNISNLRENSLWCSHPSKFNDPFDCAEALLWNRPPEVKSSIYYQFIMNAGFDQMLAHAKDLVAAEASAEDKDRVSPTETFIAKSLAPFRGIVCFSEAKNHLLMWGHYAQSHSGFCLEFDTTFEPFKEKLRKVTYRTKMPVHEGSVRELGARSDLTSFLLVKAKEWKYEREWRLLYEVVDAIVKYPVAALTAVYLGAKVSEATESEIRASVKPTMTRVINMELAADKYKLLEARP